MKYRVDGIDHDSLGNAIKHLNGLASKSATRYTSLWAEVNGSTKALYISPNSSKYVLSLNVHKELIFYKELSKLY